jgi:hypothetical protein
VLDDLKPYRSYGALVVRDNADGTHTVTINTFTPTDYAHGTRGMGWISQDVRTFDARLEHLVPTHSFMDFWSGWGVLEFPADVQWLGVGKDAFADDATLRRAIARHASREPSPTLASFVPADAPMVPDGYVTRVTLRTLGVGDTRASFVLHDVVFGDGATVTVTRDLDDARLQMRFTLAPDARRLPARGRSTAQFTGTLAVHLEDEHGRTLDHSFAVTGPIELEGETVFAPTGFALVQVEPKLCGGLDCMPTTLKLPAAAGHKARSIYLQYISLFDGRYDHP